MNAQGLLALSLASVWLGACGQSAPPAPQVRYVRAVEVARRPVSEPVYMMGQVKTQDEIVLAFRIDGKVTERRVAVGDKVTAGQLIARLDPLSEQNALRAAEADVAAARAAVAQAEKLEARQKELISRNITTRALYDQSLQQLQTSQAQLDAAQARLGTAKDRVEQTELFAEVGGTITAKGAEPGEVVRSGQMIARITREDRKDAIFDMPAQLMQSKMMPRDPVVEVALADNPAIKTTGRVREIAPQPDPATLTFPIKVGLEDAPDEIHVGATVTGGIMLTSPPVMSLPATALFQTDGKPSVWVVQPRELTVALRPVQIARYETSVVVIADGLRDGEMVVTAGVHALHPGQKVRVLPGSS